MITNNNKLIIFEDFFIEASLPKFKKIAGQVNSKVLSFDEFVAAEGNVHLDSDDSTPVVTWNSPAARFSGGLRGNSGLIVGTTNLVKLEDSFLSRLITWIGRLFGFYKTKEEQEIAQEKVKLSIEEFFASIKSTMEESKIVEERAKGYKELIAQALANNQVALSTQLRLGLMATRSEAHLVSLGLNKYITEETLVSFVKKAKKGLQLYWISNYAKIIPKDVGDKKKACDERGIFDNYVVLCYDPEKKSWEATEQEKEAERARRRDPILFGLINGKRQLYFIGDWVDETCDLTLDQIADTLGADAVRQIE